MKLNFWQWIGIVIVAVALIFIIRRETAERGGPNRPPNPAPELSPHQAIEVPTTQAAPSPAAAAAAPTTGPAAP